MGAQKFETGVKAYKVSITLKAGRELDGITDKIAEEAGGATARRWAGRLRDQVKTLRHLPFRGVPDEHLPNYHRLIVAPYVIIYRVVEPDRVFVLRVLDGRRDLASLLKSAGALKDDL